MSGKNSQERTTSELEAALNAAEESKNFLRTVLDGQTSLIAVISEERIVDVNKAFLNFFDMPSLEHFLEEVSDSLGILFESSDTQDYLRNQRDGMGWIEYVLYYDDEQHKALIRNHVFHVSIVKETTHTHPIYIVTLSDITELERAHVSIEDSIEYASLIQHSLVPDNEVLRKYVDEFFVIWHPRDVVGGDIYLLEELRNDDEMMLVMVDCAGHGVPGAFVTMLVKAIERQIVGRINNSDEKVDPVKLLVVFNRSMKHLLKQEDRTSISNAGFDGGILYYNRLENKITYAGARTPLYYFQNGKLDTFKSDRHSLGYKRSNPNFEFTNYELEIKDDTTIYLSTDGFFDQSGGEEGLPFGKKGYEKLIKEYGNETLADQQEVFLDAFLEHRDERIQNDDITVLGLKFSCYNQTKLKEKDHGNVLSN